METITGLHKNNQRGTLLRKLPLSIFLCCLFVVVSAFRSPPPPLLLTAADNGKTETVYLNAKIVIQLASNPSTGYSWRVTNSEDVVLKFRSQRYIPPTPQPGHPNNVGAPGTVEIIFTANAVGTEKLILTYQHSWEKTKPATTYFTNTIHVRAAPR